MWRAANVLSVVLVLTTLALGSCAETPDPPAGSRRLVITTSDGERLDAIEAGRGRDVAVLSHGATSSKEDFYGLAGALADDGWRVIAYDARGVGESTGTLGADREEDLRAVVARARADGVDSLLLAGGSLGGSLSISMAAELHASAVAALSPPADAFGALDVAEALRDAIPAFVAAAAENEPFTSDARSLARALGTAPVIVSGDGHGTGMFDDHPELIGRVVAFADRAVGRPSRT
jgi:pimeloyl-ACP methyl ester carboxylesterase